MCGEGRTSRGRRIDEIDMGAEVDEVADVSFANGPGAHDEDARASVMLSSSTSRSVEMTVDWSPSVRLGCMGSEMIRS